MTEAGHDPHEQNRPPPYENMRFRAFSFWQKYYLVSDASNNSWSSGNIKFSGFLQGSYVQVMLPGTARNVHHHEGGGPDNIRDTSDDVLDELIKF